MKQRSPEEISADLASYLDNIYGRCPYAEQNHMICLAMLMMDNAPFDVMALYNNMHKVDQEKLQEAFDTMREDDMVDEYVHQMGKALKKDE